MTTENTAEGVTYVGGQAVEQDGGNDGPEEGSAHADELQAARDAVRKALAKEVGEDSAAKAKESEEKRKKALSAKSDREPDDDEAPESKPAPKAKAEPKKEESDEDVDPTKASIKEVLKNREKLARQKQAHAQEIAQQQQYLQQMQRQLQTERQAIEQEKQRLQMLRKDPARAIAEAGWDPDDLILSLAQEGTPEGKMAKLMREQQQQLQQIQSWREEQAKAAQKQQEDYQVQQLVQARQNVEQVFTKGALNEERFPHLASFYSGREGALVAEGDLVAHKFREATGQEASLEQIAAYIEEELAERANNWYLKKSGAGNAPNGSRQDAAPIADTAKPGRGGKGKQLTGNVTSERRALGKDLTDLDGDERLLAAREAVKVAMAASRET